jgi:hypothetical protein
VKALDELTTQALATFLRLKWGMAPTTLLREIVHQKGAVGALRWMAKEMPPYETNIRKLGGLKAHLLYTVASLLNGCTYCTHAEARSFGLYYFREHSTLFPIDERGFMALASVPDADLKKRLGEALKVAGLESTEQVIERL